MRSLVFAIWILAAATPARAGILVQPYGFGPKNNQVSLGEIHSITVDIEAAFDGVSCSEERIGRASVDLRNYALNWAVPTCLVALVYGAGQIAGVPALILGGATGLSALKHLLFYPKIEPQFTYRLTRSQGWQPGFSFEADARSNRTATADEEPATIHGAFLYATKTLRTDLIRFLCTMSQVCRERGTGRRLLPERLIVRTDNTEIQHILVSGSFVGEPYTSRLPLDQIVCKQELAR